MSDELNNHDPLRELIHQSLAADQLAPSADLRFAVEQRLDEELVTPPPLPEKPAKPGRRGRTWQIALLVTAATVLLVWFTLPQNVWRPTSAKTMALTQNNPRSENFEGTASFLSMELDEQRVVSGDESSSRKPNYTTRGPRDYLADGNVKEHSELPDYLVAPNEGRNKALAESQGRENAVRGTAVTDGLPDYNGESPRGQPTSDFDFRFAQDTFKSAQRQIGGYDGGKEGSAQSATSPQGRPDSPQAGPKYEFGDQTGGGKQGGPASQTGGSVGGPPPKSTNGSSATIGPYGGKVSGEGKPASADRPTGSPQELMQAIRGSGKPGNPASGNGPATDPAKPSGDTKEGYIALAPGKLYPAEKNPEQTIAARTSTVTEQTSPVRAEEEKLRQLTAKYQSQAFERGANHPEMVQLRREIEQVATHLKRLDDLSIAEAPGTEQYDAIHDNPFLPVKDAPLSTFSIDVDTASYANVRRFLTQGQVPPRDAVRIEELLNYFSYDYPAPKGDEPFSVNMETAPCPWQSEHLLLRVGLRGKEVHKQERPASNIVFLIDTSGSMSSEDKLPLVKQSLSMLTRELGERDRITIVTYAGEAGLRLAPTNGTDRDAIISTINSLNSNGSTHGSAGIQLAYEKARQQFIKEGTNRVILCTDGDLNVGVTRDEELVDLIAKEAKSDVFLTVLGFGTGNLKDSKMEKLADHGNGVYAYIDGVREAKKVLVDQLSGSLTTIAKDVKIQIEFNPSQIRGYRLIGYENRVLAAKDFNDDTKDAGEIGAGHTVTALYELVPAGAAEPRAVLDELKYQKAEGRGQKAEVEEKGEQSKELLTLKLRFKQPDGDVSKKVEYPLVEKGTRFANSTSDFRFAAAVAGFGMIMRDSPYRGGITMAGVGEIAASSLGEDEKGYRAEFLDLVRRAEKLGKR
jgi:Ca-activated chloride channel family protein